MAEVTTEYSVDITTAPLPGGIGDIEALIDAVADVVYMTDLAASFGGDLAERTVGITATVDAPAHLAAADMVFEVFGQACRRAGLVERGPTAPPARRHQRDPFAILPAA
jgi:hypothetical protein